MKLRAHYYTAVSSSFVSLHLLSWSWNIPGHCEHRDPLPTSSIIDLMGKLFFRSPRPDQLFVGMNYLIYHSPNSTAGSHLPTALRKLLILQGCCQGRHLHIYFHTRAEAFCTTLEMQLLSDPQILPGVCINSEFGFVNIWTPSYLTQNWLFSKNISGMPIVARKTIDTWLSSVF